MTQSPDWSGTRSTMWPPVLLLGGRVLRMWAAQDVSNPYYYYNRELLSHAMTIAQKFCWQRLVFDCLRPDDGAAVTPSCYRVMQLLFSASFFGWQQQGLSFYYFVSKKTDQRYTERRKTAAVQCVALFVCLLLFAISNIHLQRRSDKEKEQIQTFIRLQNIYTAMEFISEIH